MRKKLIIGVAAVVVFAFVVWNLLPGPPVAQTVQFADGSTSTFLGVTSGATNSIMVGKGWQKVLYKLLPARFQHWSHASLITSGVGGFSSNSPSFWFDEQHPQQPPAPQVAHRWTAIDEFGCEYSQTVGSASSSSWLSQYEVITVRKIEPTAPHGRIAALAVYDTADSTNRLATFIVPGLSLPPSLPADSTPLARAQAGDIQVELLDLITGLNCAEYPGNYPPNSNGTAISQVIFRISRNGQPLPQWIPYRGIRLTSRSGLVVHPRYWSWGQRDGNLALNFEGSVDPAQGPWKLRLELIHETDFSPDELVSLPGVSLPAAGLTNQIGLQTNFLGETILVERAYGASNTPPSSVSGYFGQQPFLEVSISPELSWTRHVQLVKAVDEAGTNRSFSVYPGMDAGKYYFSLQADPKPHLLNLTFALHASRFVEFEANPRVGNGKGPVK